MTREDLKKISFKMIAHLSMEDEHSSSYISTDPNINIGMCVHQPYRNGEPKGKCYIHYKWNGKVYKSVGALLNDMNKVQKGNKETDK